MAPREKWTDDRLDDLNKRVDDGFARVEGDIRELRVEVKKQGESLRAEMSTGFGKAEASLEKTGTSLETRLEKTGARLEKKIEDTKVELEKKIENTKVDLEKKIDDGIGRLESDNSSLKRIIYAAVAAVILSQIADISPL